LSSRAASLRIEPVPVATASRYILFSLLFAASVLLTMWRPATSQGLAVVRVIGPSVDGYTPAWVGEKLGIFKKYGLDVQLSIASNGAAAAAALSGGAADVSYGNVISVIQAHVHDVPLQFIAPGVWRASEYWANAAGLGHLLWKPNF
jgi:ABC-type nitrate/sulfonate/bicarbonate transport system substrate-binding protein